MTNDALDGARWRSPGARPASVAVTLPAQTATLRCRLDLRPRHRLHRTNAGSTSAAACSKGDLLVLISAPDTDAQLAQAQAQLAQMQAALLQAQSALKQAQANSHLAGLTKSRSTTLAGEGWTTRQTADSDVANASVQTQGVDHGAGRHRAWPAANIRAQQATVNRLATLVGYERVVAPFDGVITARRTDIGDLVQADYERRHLDVRRGGRQRAPLRRSTCRRRRQSACSDGIAGHRHRPRDAGAALPRPGLAQRHGTIDITSRSMLTEVDIPNQRPPAALRALRADHLRRAAPAPRGHDPRRRRHLQRPGPDGRRPWRTAARISRKIVDRSRSTEPWPS